MALSDEPLPRVRFPDFVRTGFPSPLARTPGTWEEPSATYVAPATWRPEDIEPVARHEIFDRALRPHDLREASHVDPPTLAWVPIWRVELLVNGTLFYVHGPSERSDEHSVVRRIEDGNTTGGVGLRRFKNTQVWWAMPARRKLPLPHWMIFSDEVQNDPEQHRGFYELGDAVPLSAAKEAGARDLLGPDPLVFASDIAEHEARGWAKKAMLARVSDAHATQLTLSRPEVKVMGAQHLLWPVYFVPYAYVGRAAPARREAPYLVVVSARTGQVVHRDHPSGARAVLSRIATLLTFDKSGLR